MAYNGALGAGGCIPTTPNAVVAAAATPPMIDGPQNKKIRTGGQPTDQTDIHQNRVSLIFVVILFIPFFREKSILFTLDGRNGCYNRFGNVCALCLSIYPLYRYSKINITFKGCSVRSFFSLSVLLRAHVIFLFLAAFPS